MKKNIARLLVALLACTFTFGVGNASVQTSKLISECSSSLASSGNTVTVYFKIMGTSIMDEIGASKITVQRYNGSSWVTVKTFTLSNTAGMTSQNVRSHSGSVTYNATTSGTYRAVVEVFATLDGVTDSRTLIAT